MLRLKRFAEKNRAWNGTCQLNAAWFRATLLSDMAAGQEGQAQDQDNRTHAKNCSFGNNL